MFAFACDKRIQLFSPMWECLTKTVRKLKYLFILFRRWKAWGRLYLNLLKVNELKNKGRVYTNFSERDVVLSAPTKRITRRRNFTEKETFEGEKSERMTIYLIKTFPILFINNY